MQTYKTEISREIYCIMYQYYKQGKTIATKLKIVINKGPRLVINIKDLTFLKEYRAPGL